MASEIFTTYGYGFLLSIVLFGISLIPSLKYKNGAIADISWSVGFTLLIAFYYFSGSGWIVRKSVIAFMIAMWSLRLAYHLAKRTIQHLGKEDSRYKHLRSQTGLPDWLYFLWIFFCQAILQAAVSYPFVVSCFDSYESFRILELFASFLFFVGFLGEHLADKQLSEYKADMRNDGGICKVGLWRYSRHPNYFFEWLIWCSFFLFACSSPFGFWSIFSPAVMLLMLLVFSGVKISEDVSIKSKGEAYKQYQKETSAFFPWFPKRSS